MTDKELQLLQESIKQAGQIKKGLMKPSRATSLTYPNVKELRSSLSLSQRDFALLIGVSVRTLQNWEQERREPEGPAKALLKVAASNPEVVLEALSA